MIRSVRIRVKVMFILLYIFLVLSLYSIVYFEYGLGEEDLSYFLICMNLLFISPYVLGVLVASLSNFLSVRNVLINLVCFFVCSYSLLLHTPIHSVEKEWEVLALFFISLYQLGVMLLLVSFVILGDALLKNNCKSDQ